MTVFSTSRRFRGSNRRLAPTANITEFCKHLQRQIPLCRVVLSLKNDKMLLESLRNASLHEECRDLRTDIFFRLARLVVDLSLHNCCSTPVDVFVELVPRFVQFNFSVIVFLIQFTISIAKNLTSFHFLLALETLPQRPKVNPTVPKTAWFPSTQKATSCLIHRLVHSHGLDKRRGDFNLTQTGRRR